MADLLDGPGCRMFAGLRIGQLAIALALEQQLDSGLDLARKTEAVETELFDAGAIACIPFDTHQHLVDGIDRGAGHESDDHTFLLARDLDETLDPIHVSSTSRRLPL